MQDDGRDLIFVSDLHLSAGYDPHLGTFDRNEDFFYDDAFARFLNHLRARARDEGRRWRLVILGDLFDFLQVTPPGADPLDRGEALTNHRLEHIARGHPHFFRALGDFAADFPVVIVPGNHDIELIRPGAQARLRELLVAASRPEAAEGITFCPWIFYIPGVVYAEHGQQYDDDNSFARPLAPYLDPDDPTRIDLPLGSYFVAYLFNKIEWIDPFADNVKPASAYFTWALRTHPIEALATLGAHVGLFVKVLRSTDNLASDAFQARRDAYQESFVRPYAATLGLPPETVIAIDELAAIPAMTNKFRQLRALILRPTIQAGATVATVATAALAISRLNPLPRALGMLSAGAAGVLWQRQRARRRPPTAVVAGGYLRRASRQLAELLTAAGAPVPYFVFGHTHQPEQYLLTSDRDSPRYLNSGTWTPSILSDYDLFGLRERFTLVQILRDPHARGAPQATLRLWNDTAGRDELLPLLAV